MTGSAMLVLLITKHAGHCNGLARNQQLLQYELRQKLP